MFRRPVQIRIVPKNPPSPSAAAPLRALLALGLVNLLLVAPLWWRDGAWGSAWLVPEVGLLALLAAWPLARRSTALQWALAGVLTFLAAALLGDALVRAVYGRPLDVLLDPLLLGAGFHLIAGSLGLWAAVLASLLAAAGVIVTAWSIRRMLGNAFSEVPPAGALAVSLVAVALLAVDLRAPGGGLVRPAVVELAQAQAGQVRDTLAEHDALLARAASPRMAAQPIPTLAGRDVVVVFVESYGASALDQPRYADTLRPVLADAEAELAAAGLASVSTRMASPIRGGQSWLAHASALAGQPVDNNYWYSLLLDSGQDFLTDDLRATGHTPLVVAPAIVEDWPEAEALGFDAVYPADALDYRGPSSGWVGIPDPYTLHRYGRHIRPRHEGPVFAMLLLISSHAPWSPNPPLPDDPAALDRDDPWPDWDAPEHDPLAYWRDTDRLRERYPRSLAYSLQAVFDWAARDLPDDALLVVAGDHQPATLITGFEAGPDVPVHFVSGDADLLATLAPAGATNGLFPAATADAPGLEAFRFLLRGR
jgi:hypothetical protein